MLKWIEAHLVTTVDQRVNGRVVVTELQKKMISSSLMITNLNELTMFFCREFGVRTPRMIPRSPVVCPDIACNEFSDDLCPFNFSIEAKFCSLR